MKRDRQPFLLAIVAAFLLAAGACTKDDDYVQELDYNTAGLLIADNHNLSIFNAAMRPLGMQHVLQETGPFTVLVPGDAAFNDAGWDARSVQLMEGEELARLMRYHVVDGRYELDKLPFLFNHEIRSRGGKLYVTHWIKGPDTVITINGSRVLRHRVPASNGLIHIIDRVLEPYRHDMLADAIGDNDSLTFFREMVRTAGMDALLAQPGEYTVFAPTNWALKTQGYTSIPAIRAADPGELEALLQYHIVPARRFVYDYLLAARPEQTASQQAMLNGYNLTVAFVPDNNVPGGFAGIRLQGPGNTKAVEVINQDVMAGNGVLHTIDGVLKITR